MLKIQARLTAPALSWRRRYSRYLLGSMSRFFRNHWRQPGLLQRLVFSEIAMKPLILCTAILGIVFVPAAAKAKGCIKGAIVGGVAGHLAGHGKVGVVAGCIIGRHEANKRNAGRTDQKAPPSVQDNRI
jgi:hypothetical protein